MKKLYLILIFIVGLTIVGFAQNRIPNDASTPSTGLVKYYPNPAAVFVTFEFQKAYKKSYTFQMYNFMGRKVVELKSPSPKFSINLQDFFRGVYIYQIRDANLEIIESGKLQVVGK